MYVRNLGNCAQHIQMPGQIHYLQCHLHHLELASQTQITLTDMWGSSQWSMNADTYKLQHLLTIYGVNLLFIPCTLIVAAGAQPRELLIALHGATHRPPQLRLLTEPPPKPNMVNGAFRRKEIWSNFSNHKAEAGDGANFKLAISTRATAHMSIIHPNVMFGTNQCSSKWGRVCQCLLSQWLTNCYSIA